jgi:drug/metabolite transporter (DMT)-like permease
MHKGIVYALMAAALFGGSTPLAKSLGGHIAPVMLAGLLYLGSGLGLLVWYLVRRWASDGSGEGNGLRLPDAPWLMGAILAGGIAGPVLLMTGLSTMPASTSSLLLNLEGVLTAVLAWVVFRENVDRRVLFGMVLIVVAGILLSWDGQVSTGVPWGAIAIAGACLCWAIDNNLTRKVSGSDAVQIAGIKGLTAGIVNLTIAVQLGQSFPPMDAVASAAVVGFLGYGLSLVLFVLALRHLGTARTGAYFSAAPFVGATLSLMILGEVPGALFWIAAALMAAGIWLHVTERHSHEHTHEPLAHAHTHVHDSHHQHEHEAGWDGTEPHSHFHVHDPITHAHSHYPDIHHRHRH